jgi:hypothetical protein
MDKRKRWRDQGTRSSAIQLKPTTMALISRKRIRRKVSMFPLLEDRLPSIKGTEQASKARIKSHGRVPH